MVLRFYQLTQQDRDALYALEDQFPESVTVARTLNALSGEQYVELILGLSGIVLPLVAELIQKWAKERKKDAPEIKETPCQNGIKQLDMRIRRANGTVLVIQADSITPEAAALLIHAANGENTTE